MTPAFGVLLRPSRITKGHANRDGAVLRTSSSFAAGSVGSVVKDSQSLSLITRNRSTPAWVAAAAQTTVNAIPDFVDSRLLRGERVIIGIAGMPGSGKTTLATALIEKYERKDRKVQMLPMDGFHFYRDELDKFDDPAEAHKRRGAPYTFDAASFVATLKKLRTKEDLMAPGFDHRAKDPTPDAIRISSETELVVVEGNYLLLDESPWDQVKGLLDAIFYLDTDLDVAMNRVAGRHVAQLGLSLDDAWRRVCSNDRLNAELINLYRERADFIVTADEILML